MATFEENEFFRQSTLRILGSLNSETAMQRCMDYLKQFIPVSGMFFGYYDPEISIARLLAATWPMDGSKPAETVAIPKTYEKWMKQQLAKDEGVRIINDIGKVEGPLKDLILTIWPENTTHLIMDLHLENKRLGILHIFSTGKRRYTKTHAHLISMLHEPFAIAMSNILQHQEILRLKDLLADDNSYLQQQMRHITGDTIIGADFGLKGVMQMVYQVAPLNSPVLLMGETGVGKELIANAIQFASPRKNRPFIRVNCGAIPENLIDSELFGHEKGAFTGALALKRGRFERAHTGTIFLDEVAELPPAAQLRLLRVLQQHEIERVGGTETIPVNVRVISATHQNLEAMVHGGKFREDLWFRLNVFPIIIPPLRRRIGDIPALVNYFFERKSKELDVESIPPISPATIQQLQSYGWPGNVRELENFVERTLIQNRSLDHVDFDPMATPPMTRLLQSKTSSPKHNESILPLDVMIADHITMALSKTKGKIEGKDGAARLLKVHHSTLRGRMRKMGIPHGRQKSIKE